VRQEKEKDVLPACWEPRGDVALLSHPGLNEDPLVLAYIAEVRSQ
jgi:hypothetical protein